MDNRERDLREAIAEAIWNHDADEAQAVAHSGYTYARWPQDAAKQPYCQSTYRQADAVLAVLGEARATIEGERGELGFNSGRLYQFERMKKERPIDPCYWDKHEEREIKDAIESAQAERVLEVGGDKGAGYCREVREAVHGSDKPSASVPVAAAAPLPTAREGLEALLTRYEALPGDDNLSVEFVRQDLRAVKAGTYNPHRR